MICEHVDTLPRLDLAHLPRNHRSPGATFERDLGYGNNVILQVDQQSLTIRMGMYDTVIKFDLTANHLGGSRMWLKCPTEGCGRRCRIVYLDQGRIKCRICANTRYRVETEGKFDRTVRRAQKARLALGWTRDLRDASGWKPRGMHWRTFWPRLDRALTTEREAWTAVSKWLERRTRGSSELLSGD
jgi:hypothetical protein